MMEEVMIGTAELERLYDWGAISSLTSAHGAPVSDGALPADSISGQDFSGGALLDALQIILSDAPLNELLEMVTLLVEEQIEGAYCSILIADDDGSHLRYGAAPNLPDSYKNGVDGLKVGADMGPCAAAAYLRQRVYVSDIMQDQRWPLYRQSVLPTELRACWVTPIMSHDTKVLGTLAMFNRANHRPGPRETRLLESARGIAAIAIERHQTSEKLRKASAELEKASAENEVLKGRLNKDNVALREKPAPAPIFEEIVGSSDALQAVLSRLTKVAPTDSGVLITGETGTGKELIARAIHKRSQRAGKPFISVNCAALAPSLISSELFGHERGAFTGAMQRRLGRFEMADGGTIFLDEVGELPMDTQVALLRVLQEREFERVGGTKAVKVDVRVIAATNRDLEAAIANGTFRPDLFYRLNVFPIEAPPLRERKDDVMLLLEHFVHRFGNRLGKNFSKIDKETLEMFRSYDWPGNIRELQNIVERSVIVSCDGVFCVDEAWISSTTATRSQAVASVTPLDEELAREREVIEAALAESRGRVSGPNGAAVKLKLPPSTLDFRIKKLKISKHQFRRVGR